MTTKIRKLISLTEEQIKQILNIKSIQSTAAKIELLMGLDRLYTDNDNNLYELEDENKSK